MIDRTGIGVVSFPKCGSASNLVPTGVVPIFA